MCKKILYQAFLVCGILLISGCSSKTIYELTHYDPYIDIKHRADYYDILGGKLPRHNVSNVSKTQIKRSDESRPNFDAMIIKMAIYSKMDDKLITINASKPIDTKDLIIELGRLVGIDVQISSRIDSKIVFTITQKPLKNVLERLCSLARIRFIQHDDYISFEADDPYVKTYSVSFLNITRSGQSSQNVSTSVVSANISGGAQFSMKSEGSDTFWKDMLQDLNLILSGIGDPAHAKNGSEEATIDISAKNQNISLNKQAGIITVFASDHIHRKIGRYLNELRKKVTAQVLLEVKFAEISLSSAFSLGIDWSRMNVPGVNFNSSYSPAGSSEGKQFTISNAFGDGLKIAVNMLDQFGTTRILSNPRINAINNQPATLTVANNEVYFKINVNNQTVQSSSGNVANRAAQATAETIPIGIVLVMQPSIDIERREILMSIRPTITRKNGYVEDPSISMNDPASKVVNKVPVTVTREIDSIVRMKDGDVLLMGGFTERSTIVSENGVPGLSEVPLFGNLFKSKTSSRTAIETVIIIKATIIDIGDDGLTDVDRHIYTRLTQDPRIDYTF